MLCIIRCQLILGAFVKLHLSTVIFMSVHPSVDPHATTRLLLSEFLWIFIRMEGELESVEKSQVSLKQDKNNRQFAWRPTSIYITLNYSRDNRSFRRKSQTKSKHASHFRYVSEGPAAYWTIPKKYGRAREAKETVLYTCICNGVTLSVE